VAVAYVYSDTLIRIRTPLCWTPLLVTQNGRMVANTTLRLVFPQWQGGDNPVYQLGARLSAWLAPQSDAVTVEVPVEAPTDVPLAIEEGILAKFAVLRQNRAAREIVQRRSPERIVTFGGDCSVSLVPFTYLAERYDGDVAVLWIDSHTDLSTSATYPRAHGYPARNMLGLGDPDFAEFASTPIPTDRLAYVGVKPDLLWPGARTELARWGAPLFDPDELSDDFSEIVTWVRSTGASRLLVHFDLDSLDPTRFRSQLFNNPTGELDPAFAGIQTGRLLLTQVVDLLLRVGDVADVVALSVTEHLPWDAENLRQAYARLPILQ